jgi:hypothetical protein
MKKERILLAIGLLLVTAHYFIDPFYPLPDFFKGLLTGTGLGLEIIALIKMRKKGGGICSKKQEPIV